MTFKTKLLVLALIPAVFAIVGCGSDETYSPMAVDTAPPATPDGLTTKVHNSSVVVDWYANSTDADFSGYRVYRVVDRQMIELTLDEIAENSFTDRSPAKNKVNEYRVTSIDFTGNESASSSTTVFYRYNDDQSLDPNEFQIDTLAPDKPKGLTAKLVGSSVVLDWRSDTSDVDFKGFKVYRIVSGEKIMQELTYDTISKSYFCDRSPMQNCKNEYRVTSSDLTGNESGHTIVSIYVGDDDDVTTPDFSEE